MMAGPQEHLGQPIGDYRLIRQLGKGTFGTVYLAEHRYDQTQAAVKVLSLPLRESHDFREFLGEVRPLVRLRHPHIVSILDLGLNHDDLPFLVMEYAAGGTLHQHHSRGSTVPGAIIVSYVQQIAAALQYAHDHRIIHRDVKPENILLRDEQTILLSDFGIAKIVEQSSLKSLHTQAAGTPGYMAPEQSQGKPCPASDQYALAVLVYEWLSGSRPFVGGPLEVLLQHRVDPPPSLCARCPHVSRQMEQVLFTALAKTPEERFATVTHFAQALQTAMQAVSGSTQLPAPLRALPSSRAPSSSVHPPLALQPQDALVQTGESARPITSQEIALSQPSPLELTPPSGKGVSALQQTADPVSKPSLRKAPFSLGPKAPPEGPTPPPSVRKQPSSIRGRASVSLIFSRLGKHWPSTLVGHPEPERERRRMLARMNQIWIEGVLNASLHQPVMNLLDAPHQQVMVAKGGFPRNLMVQWANGSGSLLSSEVPIITLYDQSAGNLLIVGASGAGKTTLLLSLARDLITRAQKEEHRPLPLICSLASWASRPSSIEAWLIEELQTYYQLSRRQAMQWVIQPQQLCPLFEGLDDVPAEQHAACLEALAVYSNTHPAVPIVVCSSQEVQPLIQQSRLSFQIMLRLQPYTPQQVDEYLSQAGMPLQVLRNAVQADTTLQALAATPLMLDLLILTYRHRSDVKDLQMINPEQRPNHVYSLYSRRMLQTVTPDGRFLQSSLQGLRWLACVMKQQRLACFCLEQVKPEWLDDRLRRTYYSTLWLDILLSGSTHERLDSLGLFVRLFVGALLGLLGLLLPTVTSMLIGGFPGGFVVGFMISVLDRLVGGWLIGLVGGLIGAVLGVLFIGSAAWILVLLGGLLGWLLFGGLITMVRARPNCLPDILNRSLWRGGYTPKKQFLNFLDDAAQRHLLHKMGTRYRFIHPSLLDYFASDETREIPSL